MIPELTLGDDIDLEITLVDADGDVVNVSAADSIDVALIKTDHSAIVAGPYTASSGYTGATWSSGVVVVPVLGVDTNDAGVIALKSEVRVIGGANPGTYFGRINIKAIQGLIVDVP